MEEIKKKQMCSKSVSASIEIEIGFKFDKSNLTKRDYILLFTDFNQTCNDVRGASNEHL